MIHPTETTVNYIFDKFLHRYCSLETRELCEKIDQLRRNIYHEPRFPASPVYQQHLRNTIQQIEEMEKLMMAAGRSGQGGLLWDQEKLMLSKRIITN